MGGWQAPIPEQQAVLQVQFNALTSAASVASLAAFRALILRLSSAASEFFRATSFCSLAISASLVTSFSGGMELCEKNNGGG